MSNKWRRANIVLLSIIILVNGYVICAPLWPQIHFWIVSRGHSTASQNLELKITKPKSSSKNNVLIIPKMLLETPVIEGGMGSAYSNLNKGAWRLPISSQPDAGGNTVIAGHRFSYTGPHGVFYYLDKLKVGDEIGLRWQGKMHHYRVTSTDTVPATQVSVQAPTNDERLTLYTCTPLWNPVNRLVVVAKPIEAKL